MALAREIEHQSIDNEYTSERVHETTVFFASHSQFLAHFRNVITTWARSLARIPKRRKTATLLVFSKIDEIVE